MLFKYNKVKPMSQDELNFLVLDYKRKLYAHLEERHSSQLNQRFIAYCEGEIQKLSKVLNERKVA